jgi:uncharacterized protein
MRSLVVSLHDVSPLTYEIHDRILADLGSLGINRTSLLIIPNHHGHAPIGQDSDFQRWIRQRIDAGHEPVLHGLIHLRQRRRNEHLLDRFVTRIYTADEGEFFDLDLDAARTRLRDGLDSLRFLGREIPGFIAPAWLLGSQAQQAVVAAGFRYTALVGRVRGYAPQRVWTSRSLVWSTRKPWRIAVSLAWNQTLFDRTRQNELLRISLHPPDYAIGPVWGQVRRLIERALADRRVVTYEEFVAQASRSEQ